MTKITLCHGCTNQNYVSPSSSNDISGQSPGSPVNALTFSTAVVIGLLSPLAIVGNALILATIWKRTFLRTSFHFILSGLAVTDFLTGIISQPFYASLHLIETTNSTVIQDNPKVVNAIEFIAQFSTFIFVYITVAVMTLLSVERWLHMSRRSFTTSPRRYFVAIVILPFLVPLLVVYVLALSKPTLWTTLSGITIENSSFCYLIISLAYFKVDQIIRRHQLQIQANGISQSFGQPAIDLAKYKKSVATMLYIVLLFSTCFLPLAVSMVVALITTVKKTLVLVFLSSSLSPGLYLWRMRDIRSGFKTAFSWLKNLILSAYQNISLV